jgi:hypothetical protein
MVAAEDPEAGARAEASPAQPVRQPIHLLVELGEAQLPRLVDDRGVLAVAYGRDPWRGAKGAKVSQRPKDLQQPRRGLDAEDAGPYQGDQRARLEPRAPDPYSPIPRPISSFMISFVPA